MRGFLRKDGRKGIRNVVVVSFLVECAHHVAARIAQHYQEEEVHLIGFSGCAPNDYAELMMLQLCTHPNVGGVLLVSLGCENFQRERLLQDIRDSGRSASLLVIQDEGGSQTSINKGMINFKGPMLFSTHDQEIIETVANRIIEIVDENTIIDKTCTYEEYQDFLENKKIK